MRDGPGSLFRQEAERAVTQPIGDITHFPVARTWHLTVTLLLIAILSIFFLGFASVSKKVSMQGTVIPKNGTHRVTADRPGIVSGVSVYNGNLIKPGDLLLSISSDRIAVPGESSTQSLVSINKGLSVLATGESDARIAMIESRIDQARQALDATRIEANGLKESLDLQERRISLARETLESGQILESQKLISTYELRQLEENVLRLSQDLLSLRRQRVSSLSSIDQLNSQIRSMMAEQKLAARQRDTSLAELESRKISLISDGASAITSPIQGRLTAFKLRSGDRVSSEQTIGYIVPIDSEPLIELWAPSKAIGGIRIGSPVALMYDAYPFQKHGLSYGKIISVDSSPTDIFDLPAQFQRDEALYRLVVRPDSDKTPTGADLMPGMRLTADVTLERRTFLDLIFQPFRSTLDRLGEE